VIVKRSVAPQQNICATLATIMKRRTCKVENLFTLFFILFTSISCCGQNKSVKGKIIQFDSKASIPYCRIIVNNSIEFSPDTAGNFNIVFRAKKNDKIDFRSMGYYKLTLKNLPSKDSLKFDSVALVKINVGDDYFITIKENGKHYRSADRKRRIKNKNEMIKQSSQAYIIYNGNKIIALNGIIKLE
jgi:hypothetical protein